MLLSPSHFSYWDEVILWEIEKSITIGVGGIEGENDANGCDLGLGSAA